MSLVIRVYFEYAGVDSPNDMWGFTAHFTNGVSVKINKKKMKVKDLLSSHHKWCRDTYAMTADGVSCRGTASDAVRFCLLGAVEKCYEPEQVESVYQKIKKELGFAPNQDSYSIAEFNDKSNFATVKSLVEKLNI